MLTIQAVAEALMQTDVTVAGLAPQIGTVVNKGSDDYRVKPSGQEILEVSLGIPEGKNAQQAPAFVQYYFSLDHPVPLSHAVPGCTNWKMIPGNPGASPYLYACRFPGSTEHLDINFVATLSDDIKNPATSLRTLILQRNAW